MSDHKTKRNTRLIVKLLSLALLGILLYDMIKHGRPDPGNIVESFDLMGKLFMLLGLIIAWKWEGVGGWFLIGGYAFLAILKGKIFLGNLFTLYPLWGIIYLYIWVADTVSSFKKKKE